MTDHSAYQRLACPLCGQPVQVHKEDGDDTECACWSCGESFLAGDARHKGTTSETHE